ncbi:MAG: hypothetical protein IIA83_12715 [Thaumarchaeota archaeon]|nr:hypothetical protein [Nitrososphaerota archaeon]
MDYETIGVIGLMLSPLYGLIIWRMKVSREIEIKLTKICTFIKMKFPEEAKQVFG